MINRILIRMKVVQLLYSYLLVEKPFTLESQPTAPTKEKRFAYSLYLDFIYLMIRLSRQVEGKNHRHTLEESRFVKRTEKDEHLKSLETKYSESTFPFKSVEAALAQEIKGSLLFKEYEKNESEGVITDSFWEKIFFNLILPNQVVNQIIKEMPGYSLSGVERMKSLMAETFSNFYASKDNVTDALRTLELSMQKARDLYLRLLALPVELTRLRLEQLEENSKKFLATAEDLNPNMKFVNNRIPAMIQENRDFDEYVEKNHLSWLGEDRELMELILKAVLDSEVYKKYIEKEGSNLSEDSEFWHDVFEEVILNNTDFLEYLENKSVFWNDDLEIMTSFVFKTLKRLENPSTEAEAILPMYKDGENGADARFGSGLFNFAVKNKDLYRGYIEDALKRDKWEADRLAFMDIVVTLTALAEIMNYPEIPLTVSINEYIEIAKSYSSAKSGQFIHGLLASIISMLREEGKLIK